MATELVEKVAIELAKIGQESIEINKVDPDGVDPDGKAKIEALRNQEVRLVKTDDFSRAMEELNVD